MAVTFSNTNKPLNPRGNDASPLAYNRAALYSGKALDFDGVNDFANVVYSDTIGSVWTWSSIIEADALSGYQAIFGGTFGANNGLIVLKNNQLNIYTNTDNLFSYILETGKKYHVALSQSGSSVSAFINGVLVDSVSLSATLDAGGGSYYISRNPYSAIEFFNGKIAGFKIFNTALTAAQVADLYNNPEKVVPTGVDNTALKLWLPMQEGAGTTAYDGSPSGFVEDIVTGFTNGTTYPLDSFASSGGDDITTAIKTNGFGGCVSNGHYYTNGQKVKVKFTYQKNSGDDLRVLFSSVVTGAGWAWSDMQNVSASGEFEHTFTMTADGIAYLQLGTGNASDSIDAVITDVYVSPNVSANHGTISGATYVNGVGAPVAQTSVIDWNKGVNSFTYSEDFSNADWITIDVTKVSTSETDYIGGTTAANITWLAGNPRYFYQNIGLSGASTLSFYVKSNGGGNKFRLFGNGTLAISSDLTATSEWVRYDFEFTGTSSVGIGIMNATDNSAADLLVCFAQLEANATAGPYTPTFATAQPTPVLLPAGLTTGRDITGVNLFENVRKQGALNLDGSSWAEVHDNASLDISPAMTMECWAKTYDSASSSAHIFVKSSGSWNLPYGRFVLRLTDNNLQWWFDSFSNNDSVSSTSSEWYHFVVTKNGTSEILYINGVQAGTNTGAATITASDYPLYIGRADVGEYYNNQLAQPRIYNRALTASEVLRNYNSGKNTYTNS